MQEASGDISHPVTKETSPIRVSILGVHTREMVHIAALQGVTLCCAINARNIWIGLTVYSLPRILAHDSALFSLQLDVVKALISSG